MSYISAEFVSNKHGEGIVESDLAHFYAFSILLRFERAVYLHYVFLGTPARRFTRSHRDYPRKRRYPKPDRPAGNNTRVSGSLLRVNRAH